MTRRTPRRKHALRGLEVGPYLHTVDWRQCVDSLEFDYETARDEEIHATLPDEMALVVKRYRNLSLERHALQAQLYAQSPFVDRLEASRTKQAMDLDSAPNDASGISVQLVVRSFGVRGVLAFHISLFSDDGAPSCALSERHWPETALVGERPGQDIRLG